MSRITQSLSAFPPGWPAMCAAAYNAPDSYRLRSRIGYCRVDDCSEPDATCGNRCRRRLCPRRRTGNCQRALEIIPSAAFYHRLVIYLLASVVWFRVVATEPLSLAYPLLVSLTFTMVTACAVLFFKKPVSLRKVVGLAAILIG